MNPGKIDRDGPNVDRISSDGAKVMGDGRENSGRSRVMPRRNLVTSSGRSRVSTGVGPPQDRHRRGDLVKSGRRAARKSGGSGRDRVPEPREFHKHVKREPRHLTILGSACSWHEGDRRVRQSLFTLKDGCPRD